MTDNTENYTEMEDLSRKLEGELLLDLEDEETPEEESNAHLKLLGKLISDRPVSYVAVKGTIRRLWNPSKGMDIVDMVNTMLLFKFKCNLDKRKVVDNSP